MRDAHAPWAGQVLLRPGAGCPGNLASSRPDLAARVAQGRLASELPGLLSALFNLCGGAHRLCAERAVRAARRDACRVGTDALEQLRAETLREHLHRMGLDWPRLLSDPAQAPRREAAALHALKALQALRATPVDTGTADLRAATAACIGQHWLGMPAEAWLHAWNEGPRAWLAQWSAQADGWLPALLREVREVADRPHPGAPPLLAHRHPGTLQALAVSLAEPGFARQPQWQGACAETGPWARLHQRDAASLDTLWMRLGARLAEAVRLALPDAPACTGTGWLQAGQWALPGHSGMAWVEMARGLLVHRVTLDGDGPLARVRHCCVVAPTDWNFHPRGAVAQALARLPHAEAAPDAPDAPDGPGARRILALMATYDPCVPFVIERETCDA